MRGLHTPTGGGDARRPVGSEGAVREPARRLDLARHRRLVVADHAEEKPKAAQADQIRPQRGGPAHRVSDVGRAIHRQERRGNAFDGRDEARIEASRRLERFNRLFVLPQRECSASSDEVVALGRWMVERR